VSIYEVSTLGDPDNSITFNDPTIDPFYRAQTRLPQKYQLRESDVPVPFQSGISDFLTLIGDTVYQITGTMYPSNENSYDAGRQALAGVSSLDLEQSNPYSDDEGYVPYSWGDALNAINSKQLFLKVLYCDIPENTREGYSQPFTIVCKIKDPTIYGYILKTASTAAANPSSTTGTFVLPTTLPAPIGITMYTVSADANNIGTLPSFPTAITVYGPVTNPVITNSATGETITVNVTLSSGSDVLLIQYSKDNFSITKNGVNVSNLLADGSSLFKIHPGDNIITLAGGLSTGAYCTVTFYDSWPLA
jgi:hypothetical protein